MSDRFREKDAPRPEADNGDPFAELARIMGLRPEDSPSAQPAAPEEPVEISDDERAFREALAREEEASVADTESAPAASPRDADDAVADIDWDAAFADTITAGEPEQGVELRSEREADDAASDFQASQPAEEPRAAARPHDDAEDDILDVPLTLDLADWEPEEEAPIVAAPSRSEDEPAAARDAEAAPDVQLEDADFDAMLSASIEKDLIASWDGESVPEPHVEPEPAAEAPAPQPAAATADDSFEDELAALLSQDAEREATVSQPAARAEEPVEDFGDALDIPAEERAEPKPAAEPVSALPDDDPFAALAAMAARYRTGRSFASGSAPEPQAPAATIPAPPVPAVPEPTPPAIETAQSDEDSEQAMRTSIPSRGAAPEIETVHVPELFAAVPDDLDIPEMPHDERRPARAAYDDIDGEFADLLSEMSDPARATTRQSRGWSGEPVHAEREVAEAPMQDEALEGQREDALAWREADTRHAYAEDTDFEDEAEYEEERQPKTWSVLKRPGGWLMALMGTVALAGGAGYFALAGSDGISGGEPALIVADANPLKVRPENPGGTVVPNQSSKVYERVAGTGGTMGEPEQVSLRASTEEPVDLMPTPIDDPIAAGLDLESSDPDVDDFVAKSEDRLGEEAAAAEQPPQQDIVVMPRKVRTMVVRADGTMVPSDSAEAEVAAVAPAVEAAREAIRQTQEGSMAASGEAASQTAALAPAAGDDAPAAAPDPVQVASVSPGAWSIQIASQPSEQAARSSYDDLARRYSAVLGGLGVNIVKAEVAGKGTFWRVRVPAETRSAAVDLCTSLKAAGGTCFVSK